MASNLLHWVVKHKKTVALALLSLFLYVQVRFVGPYITELDSYRKLRDAQWQWPSLQSDRHTAHRPGSSTDGDAASAGSNSVVIGADPSSSSGASFRVEPITPGVFPAAIDNELGDGPSDSYYKDVDPHRGELPTRLKNILEKNPQLSFVPWPPKAPVITEELWPRRQWQQRSRTVIADASHPEAQPIEPEWRESPWTGWRPPLDNFTASADAGPLPKVQFDFDDPSKHSGRRNDPARDDLIKYRQRLVRNAFLHAWEGYKKYAWGHDELRPVTKIAQDNFNGWGATIVDALDTLLVMDLPDQYDFARQHVYDIDFTLVAGERSVYGMADGRIPVFETAIRYLGGFLSAYDLSGDVLMRDRAEELAQLIMPAFDTATGVPLGRINMQGSKSQPTMPPHSQGSVVLAEAGSLLLEFTRLWQVTGNRTYFDRVQRTTDWLDRNMTTEGRLGTLFPETLFPERHAQYGTYRFGGMADSYYEYLIKEHQLLGGRLSQYPRMYADSINSAKVFLMKEVDTVPGVRMLNIGEQTTGRFISKLEHLTCFSGAMLGLGSKLIKERKADLSLAKAFTETCWWAYNSSATGLGPENLIFYSSDDASRFELIKLKDGTTRRGRARGHPLVGVQSSTRHYLNRPETIESVLYMWRLTGDVQWQERGWQMFTSWVYHCMTDVGFSAISDVYSVPASWMDNMESFTFAETFKYYYLLFSPPELISLDEWVFTTEAHPLLAPRKGKWGVPGEGSKKFWTAGTEELHRPSPTSGIYGGGEGGPYGGLTNNQKHMLHKAEAIKQKKLVARVLIDNLATEGLKSTFKGLLNSVDWRSRAGETESDDGTEAWDADESVGEHTRELEELLADHELVQNGHGMYAFQLEDRQAAVAVAARPDGESGAVLTGLAEEGASIFASRSKGKPAERVVDEDEEWSKEVQRLGDLQVARFRSKGLVARKQPT